MPFGGLWMSGNAARHQSTCLRIKIAEVIPKILLKHLKTQFQLGIQAKLSHYVMYVIGQLAFKWLQKGREPTKKPEFTWYLSVHSHYTVHLSLNGLKLVFITVKRSCSLSWLILMMMIIGSSNRWCFGANLLKGSLYIRHHSLCCNRSDWCLVTNHN